MNKTNTTYVPTYNDESTKTTYSRVIYVYCKSLNKTRVKSHFFKYFDKYFQQ